jgi:DNA-binding LytR/AlgR family response regulator
MFFRINRGQIVHKSAILKFESYFNHRLKLKLEEAGDMEFVVSRQRSSDFKKWMNY